MKDLRKFAVCLHLLSDEKIIDDSGDSHDHYSHEYLTEIIVRFFHFSYLKLVFQTITYSFSHSFYLGY